MSTEVWCEGDGFRCKYGLVSQIRLLDDGVVVDYITEGPPGPLIMCIDPRDYPAWVDSWNSVGNADLRIEGDRFMVDAANGSWLWLLEPAHRRQPWLNARWPESLGRLLIGRWPD